MTIKKGLAGQVMVYSFCGMFCRYLNEWGRPTNNIMESWIIELLSIMWFNLCETYLYIHVHKYACMGKGQERSHHIR